MNYNNPAKDIELIEKVRLNLDCNAKVEKVTIENKNKMLIFPLNYNFKPGINVEQSLLPSDRYNSIIME